MGITIESAIVRELQIDQTYFMFMPIHCSVRGYSNVVMSIIFLIYFQFVNEIIYPTDSREKLSASTSSGEIVHLTEDCLCRRTWISKMSDDRAAQLRARLAEQIDRALSPLRFVDAIHGEEARLLCRVVDERLIRVHRQVELGRHTIETLQVSSPTVRTPRPQRPPETATGVRSVS